MRGIMIHKMRVSFLTCVLVTCIGSWLGYTALCLLSPVGAYAQGVGSSGDIIGTVADSSGAVLPGVTVSVEDPQTGLRRTAVPNGTGQFRVAGLPPSSYNVTAQLS